MSNHVITICESAESELHASGATIAVTISGQSLFTGSEAFKKAEAVAACVNALQECGVEEEQIELLDVSVQVDSGLLSKSSSATYRLRITCSSMDLLGKVLSAIASQKQVEVSGVRWTYDDLAKHRREVMLRAVRAAKDAGRAVADALDVPLLAVRQLTTTQGDPDRGQRISARAMQVEDDELSAYAGRKRKASRAIQDINLSHTTKLSATVTAVFEVGPFRAPS